MIPRKLSRYLSWHPSAKNPERIRMKLPMPMGGYYITWFDLSAFTSQDDAADAADAFVEQQGQSYWTEWPKVKPKQ